MRIDCEENDISALYSEVDPDAIAVRIDGEPLAWEEFELSGDKIALHDRDLLLEERSYEIEVDYRIRHVPGFESNDFTYQVGGSSGQSVDLEIPSFNDLLRLSNQFCVDCHESAGQTLTVIDEVLQEVSGHRSTLGAMQNRMEAMQEVAETTAETTAAAESRIRDADIAEQMMNQVKASVIQQAGQSIIAQSNQSAGRILSLLEN
nr:flagellin [Alkalicoccus urumqiensis]